MSKLVESVILNTLKKVRDPELGFNIVDAGMVRRINIDQDNRKIEIHWIPTSPFCPMVLAISAVMLYVLRRELNLEGWSIKILLDESVITAEYWNPQLREETLDRIISSLEESGKIRFFISE